MGTCEHSAMLDAVPFSEKKKKISMLASILEFDWIARKLMRTFFQWLLNYESHTRKHTEPTKLITINSGHVSPLSPDVEKCSELTRRMQIEWKRMRKKPRDCIQIVCMRQEWKKNRMDEWSGKPEKHNGTVFFFFLLFVFAVLARARSFRSIILQKCRLIRFWWVFMQIRFCAPYASIQY